MINCIIVVNTKALFKIGKSNKCEYTFLDISARVMYVIIQIRYVNDYMYQIGTNLKVKKGNNKIFVTY